MLEPSESWITGIGIVSSLGEGGEAHWRGLCEGQAIVDEQTFAPGIVHPLAKLTLDTQIPKKSDQRQMEPWQRIGVYTAGLALDDAGLKGEADLLAKTDMIVAAGGGERDIEMDERIFAQIREAPDPTAFLSERLRRDLRPTLFLAQLSNMLAGNISIVHGVTGSSRSFMGEEAAGADAVATAWRRLIGGQSERALVGGSNNGERYDIVLNMLLGGVAMQPPFRSVWDRSGAGMAIGSLGAFLVLETPDSARTRARKPLARLTHVQSERVRRSEGAVTAALAGLWEPLAQRLRPGEYAIFSGATGAAPVTAEEQAFLQRIGAPVRATGSIVGHGIEPQFVANIALAALALGQGKLFETNDTTGTERTMEGPLRQVVVTGVGHRGGEALALVEAA